MTKKPTPEDLALWKANLKDVKPLRQDKVPDFQAVPPHTDSVRQQKYDPPLPPPPLKGSPLSGLGRKELRHLDIEARLDMHGLTLESGYRVLETFLRSAQNRGIRTVIIITGKGNLKSEHTLRAQLPRWLQETSLRHLVTALAHPAKPQDGGIGAYYVRIKKRNKVTPFQDEDIAKKN